MKKPSVIMIIITSVFIVAILGIFVGRMTTDGQMNVYTSNSIRYERTDKEEYDEEPKRTVLININTADAKLLQDLPGIGKETAKRIIEYREENGPFRHLYEIKNVKGIGDETYKKIKSLITLED